LLPEGILTCVVVWEKLPNSGDAREHFGYSTLWLTYNNLLEDVQVVGLNPMLKCAQETPLRPLHSSNIFITITRSSLYGTSSRLDNGISMRFLKR